MDDAALDRFVRASHYHDPVDIKKLRYVYAALDARAPVQPAVLEVACGVGGVTLPLATLGGRVRALDIDAGDVDALRSSARRLDLGNVLATVEDALAFDDGTEYDAVVASEVFEHLTDPDALADVVARHTRPGGVLVVTTPNGYGPWEAWNSLKLLPRRWRWLRRLLGRAPHDGGGREHEQRYTRARLARLFEERGFERVDAANSDFVFTLLAPLRRSRVVGAIDTALADMVPHWMASGWYLTFIKKKDYTEE